MAGTVIADNLQAAATSQLVIKNGVASTPPTIQDSAGTTIGTFCRAWVNFNGSGTIAIRGSFNVTSITDNAVGDYTVNFTTAMSDTNYSTITSYTVTAGQNSVWQRQTTRATTSVRLYEIVNQAGTQLDPDANNVAIFR
jgi:hypothetical protein